MPYFHDYITELNIGKNASLETLFNHALEIVFSETYLKKINSSIKQRIKIKEREPRNNNVMAWVQGTTIYINKNEFYSRDRTSQIKYLLHEFMHVLNNSKSFIITSKFKEINVLSKELWAITKKYSTDPGMFLAGKKIKSSLLNNQEALSYLMNDKIDWKYMKPEGSILFKNAIKKSGVFNVEQPFWKNRLS